MIIKQEQPPNFAEILRVFPQADNYGTVFTYGAELYNPSGILIAPELEAHEQVHSERQKTYTIGVDEEDGIRYWWKHYLENREFRYVEELHAHRKEFQVFCENHSSGRTRFLDLIAGRLSSELYGSLCTFEKAKIAIKNKNNRPL